MRRDVSWVAIGIRTASRFPDNGFQSFLEMFSGWLRAVNSVKQECAQANKNAISLVYHKIVCGYEIFTVRIVVNKWAKLKYFE